jgi:predicted alpha/beta hydrolase
LDAEKDDKKFHDYSFPDLGKYDLPAQLNKVLAMTGVEKVTYVGHS